MVHHVASVYPIEVDQAKTLGAGDPIEGVTWPVIHDMNAKHASDSAAVSTAALIMGLSIKFQE